MRIAQIAPLYEAVPPKLYGGTERVVSVLTETLVAMGHDVTLFASGDSVTSARLVSPCPKALRLDEKCRDRMIPHVLLMEQVIARRHDFDVLHFHCDYLHYSWARRCGKPCLTTLHGRLDLPDLEPLYGEFDDVALVSISDAQRRPYPDLEWQGTVYHGLPPSSLKHTPAPKGDYLAFIGRFSREKRVDRAIEIAKRVGMKLKIAAKLDPAEQADFEAVKPLLDHPLVEWVGEIGDADKADFLGHARAHLFPIDWPEPFGLVMIEAMACGTPTIAFNRGSVPEVIDHGVSGFVVSSVDEAVQALGRVGELDRMACRAKFVERFSAERMAADYLGLYQRLLLGLPVIAPLSSMAPHPPLSSRANI